MPESLSLIIIGVVFLIAGFIIKMIFDSDNKPQTTDNLNEESETSPRD